MDKIDFNIITEYLDQEEPLQLSLECKINDKRIINWEELPIDVLEILESTKKSGNYCFWTCTCGIPECGGVDSKGIKVEHQADKIVWTNLDFPIDGNAEFTFDKKEYQGQVASMWKDYKRAYFDLKQRQKEFEICPDLKLNRILEELKK